MYIVVVTDVVSDEFLVQTSSMTGKGLLAILKHMTSLNRDGRNAFMREVQTVGNAAYIPPKSEKLQYGVAAMEQSR